MKHDQLFVPSHSLKRGLLFAWLIISASWVQSQNLVPNHSFEVYDPCPQWPQLQPELEAAPWISLGSANCFHACADPMYLGVPENFIGIQDAQDGFGYGGLYVQASSGNHEYLRVQLLDTLEADKCYKVSFWISLSDESCAADQIGALFTDIPVDFPIGMTPQIDYGGGQFFSDTEDWMHILGYYTALGNELYLTIGNFHLTDETRIDPDCDNQYMFAYYYVDNVVVEEVPTEPVSVDLGANVVVCDSFEIIAGSDPDIVYFWSTGEIGPSITVYTSGVYSVTASYGCSEDFDDIEVTIIGDAYVDIGADSVLMCVGDEYDISLDPGAGFYEWSDGSMGWNYTITTAGTYAVTVDNGCDIASDTIVVSTMDVPLPFTLGPDTFICPGDAYLINFDPSFGDFSWQDGSTTSTYLIDDDGSYSLTISNMCGEQSDDLEVIIIDPPMVSLTPDTAQLCEGEVLDFEFEEDMGTYLWSDNSTDHFFSINSAGQYGVTVSNACGVDSSHILVTYDSEPMVDFGPDQMPCSGDTLFLTVGNNTGTFTWHDGSSADTFIVTTSGQYALQVSNACGVVRDTLMVEYLDTIQPPDLGADINLCPGEDVIFYVTSVGADYEWSDGSTADSLLVTTAGTYFVEVYSQCESFSDTVVVTQSNSPPVANLGPDFSLCAGEQALLDAVVNGGTYVWNDGSTLSQLLISSPGTYSVTIANACGTDTDTVIVTQGIPAPTVSLGADGAICPGDTFFIVPDFQDVSTWIWQDGTSQQIFPATSAGEYFIEVSNACGTFSDTVQVSLLPDIPTLMLMPDTVLCPGESITISIGIPDVNILWSDGSSGQSVTVNDSAVVFATISNACGSSADTTVVAIAAQTPDVDLGADKTLCPGSTITLGTSITGVEYLWQDGSTNPSIDITQGGTYILMISDACGTNSDTILVVENSDGPQLNLGPDLQGCDGEMITMESDITGVEFMWQDGSDQSSFTTSVPGLFWLMVSNACGTDTDTVEVSFVLPPPMQSLGNDTTLCEGDMLLLSAVVGNDSELIWQDGSSELTFQVLSAGLYSISVSNACGEHSDSVLVSFIQAPPAFSLGPDTNLCTGETLLLTVPIDSFDITWQNQGTQSDFLVDQAGMYYVQLSNICGLSSDTILVDYMDDQPMLQLDPEILWCPGDTLVLDATQQVQADIAWSNGATTSAILVNSPGIYEVVVSTMCHTVSGMTEGIRESNCPVGPVFYIPNVFTPDQNGFNDLFTVSTDLPENVLNMQGSIFDRWGNLVFSSHENPFTWDGTFDQEDMMAGVYVYMIQVEYVNFSGQIVMEIFSGDITLLR